jgi:hypothetical protein
LARTQIAEAARDIAAHIPDDTKRDDFVISGECHDDV